MSSKIDRRVIDEVAVLAKLDLNREERDLAEADLAGMVEYIDKLKELDTEGIEPMTHIFPLQNIFRDDEVVNGDNRAEMLKNAPQQSEGQYQVPKTVE